MALAEADELLCSAIFCDYGTSLSVLIGETGSYLCTDANCNSDNFQLNSSCYKVHKNERVSWFTAVNRCLSNNASLAFFDDGVGFHQYFPITALSDKAWIGLVKSWWTWPDSGKFQLQTKLFFRFYVNETINESTVMKG